MYIKVFESRESARWYVIKHEISLRGIGHGKMSIESNDKKIMLDEYELYKIIDSFFKDNLK